MLARCPDCEAQASYIPHITSTPHIECCADANRTEELLRKAPKLKLILTAGVGSDHIDLHAAAEHGATVAEMTGLQQMFRRMSGLCAIEPETRDVVWLAHVVEGIHLHPRPSPETRSCNLGYIGQLFQLPVATFCAFVAAGSNTDSVAEDEIMRCLILLRGYNQGMYTAYRKLLLNPVFSCT